MSELTKVTKGPLLIFNKKVNDKKSKCTKTRGNRGQSCELKDKEQRMSSYVIGKRVSQRVHSYCLQCSTDGYILQLHTTIIYSGLVSTELME